MLIGGLVEPEGLTGLTKLFILDHAQYAKQLLLFEQASRGHVRFVGHASYLGHHLEERPDIEGDTRSAIVFELTVDTEPPDSAPAANDGTPAPDKLTTRAVQSLSLEALRKLAVDSAAVSADKKVRRTMSYNRSVAVRSYILRRANGICEDCGDPAPFVTKRNLPYLEPHHTHRIADGGPDHPAHVIGLCPTCHSRVHHAKDGQGYNTELIDKITDLESD